MKTIDEKIKERIMRYEMNEIEANRSEIDFKAGVKFAEEWLSVEKDDPNFGEWIFVKNENNFAAMRIGGGLDRSFLKSNFTHWRPVERQ